MESNFISFTGLVQFRQAQFNTRNCKRLKQDVIKQINLVPNFITAFGLACGLFIIFKGIHLTPHLSSYQLIQGSFLLLIIAAIADFLDGAIARVMKAESEFGFIFDTLSDAITFGVAPSVMALKIVGIMEPEGKWLFFSIASCMVFSLCGVLRLVRFNILSKQSRSNSPEEFALKKYFVGLPIPGASLGLSGLVLFLVSQYADSLPNAIKISLIDCYALLIGYLMVSRWKFPALKNLHIKVPTFDLLFISVILAVVILYGVLYYFPIVVICLTSAYIILGVVITLFRSWQARRFKKSGDKK